MPHLHGIAGLQIYPKRCAYVESVATKSIGTEVGTFGRPYASTGPCGAVAF